MQVFFQFFRDNLDLLFLCISVLCFIITFVRTGNVKRSLSDFKEVYKEMKFQTYNNRARVSSVFSEYVPDYILNPSTDELEELEQKDNIQAKIQSYESCALDKSLDKFLPGEVTGDTVYDNYSQLSSDLSALGEYMEIAEDYREKFNMPDTASVADIYAEVDKRAKSYKEFLSKATSKKEDVLSYEELLQRYNKLMEVQNGKSEKKEAE